MSNTEFASAPNEPIILAIDTSSHRASLAVSRGEDVVASLAISNNLPHSQTLFSNIFALLSVAGYEIQDVDAFVAATGPGSFTGLRVGLAAIKGLADSLGRHCLGIDSLDSLALASGLDGLHLVMIDAGRGKVYWGLREVAGGDVVGLSAVDKAGKVSSVLDLLKQDMNISALVITGSGACKSKDEVLAFITQLWIEDKTSSEFRWRLFHNDAVNISSVLARRASRLLKSGQLSPVEPHYVRPSDAELNRKR